MLEFISSLFGSALVVTVVVVGIIAGALLLLAIVIRVSLAGRELVESCGSGFDIFKVIRRRTTKRSQQ
jgi:hypothetical protein